MIKIIKKIKSKVWQKLLINNTSKIKNIFYLRSKYKLFLITDPKDWVIKSISLSIKNQLDKKYKLNPVITSNTDFLKNKIIHFSSFFDMVKHLDKTDKSNKLITSWFHVNNTDLEKNIIKEINKREIIIHTASSLTKKEMIKLGLKEELIKVIPLGINTDVFKPTKNKETVKKELGLPQNKIIIGSFQKDGNGWEEGLEPKLIKGPDIFCKVMQKLSKKYPIHVLLTGPARGYVKNKLTEYNVSFTHKYIKKYNDIAKFYNALDLYIITSRLEGGPMAILESWATGTPLVSTKVGMIPDIALDNENALLTDIEDIKHITSQAEKIINDNSISKKLSSNALKKAQKYSWHNISNLYYQKLYKSIIYK